MAVLPSLPIEILIFSFGMLLPLITAVGIFVTHRIAGPVYRFEQYLTQVANGERVGPCTLREGDELQDLCAVINRAVDVWREEKGAERSADSRKEEKPELIRQAG